MEHRFRALRDAQVTPVRELLKVEVLTSDVPRVCAGLTLFRMTCQTSDEANDAIATLLYEEFGIFAVYRGGVAGGSCIRETPGLENPEEDCEKLADAIKSIAT